MGVSKSDRIGMSTLGDDGHWFVLDWGSWVGCGLRVCSALKDSLRSFINFSMSVCCTGKSSEYFCGHMKFRNIPCFILIVK